jgi:hypothetical protein
LVALQAEPVESLCGSQRASDSGLTDYLRFSIIVVTTSVDPLDLLHSCTKPQHQCLCNLPKLGTVLVVQCLARGVKKATLLALPQ